MDKEVVELFSNAVNLAFKIKGLPHFTPKQCNLS